MTTYVDRFPADSLSGWIAFGRHLATERNKYGKRQHIVLGIDRLWNSLNSDWLKTATALELNTCETIIISLRLRPMRGHRRGTKWEDVNMAIQNRRFMLRREEDQASMGTGHNINLQRMEA